MIVFICVYTDPLTGGGGGVGGVDELTLKVKLPLLLTFISVNVPGLLLVNVSGNIFVFRIVY